VTRSGPILIAFDGSRASELAIREAGPLLAGRPALVVVVWKPGLGFELVELPTSSVGLPPVAIDIRTALEIDQELHERAQRLAGTGAQIAREAGFDADAVVVADDVDVGVGDVIARTAVERDAPAVVLGAHSHRALGELPGRIARRVLRLSPCPVVLVRERDERGERDGDR
jgi:nucleotide-binding universal stress UspA family protein